MFDEWLFFFLTLGTASFVVIYAYLKKKIDFSALIGCGLIGGVVLLTLGVEWIYLLLGFFVLGNFVTRYRYKVKEKNGVAEGTRTFRNVFGNGGSAVIYAIFYFLTKSPLFQMGFLGAMATAGADTFATETGEAHEKNPWLITSLEKVRLGTPGAVSLPGCGGSLLGSALVSFIPLIFGREVVFLLVGTGAGFIGCHIDSLVGATIERKIIDKHMTNFLATLSGGIVAIGLFYFL
jgi:uncharacterized protein (TIGR00297 family)